ncbi:unnamed protein product [Gongylonema pulchrum]|uniref:Beta-N-acetylhexosaminidase n=1 Tax=Gongylonema pulchrum TaxID=637853 RepID=A0A183DZ15_9BILA|nr:unnamed protein product [Gongylonema pulchrum]
MRIFAWIKSVNCFVLPYSLFVTVAAHILTSGITLGYRLHALRLHLETCGFASGGAAPKIGYLLKLVPFVKEIGATGVMIEYEDMFPFTGKLSSVKAGNAYSMEDLRRFLRSLETHNLDIIPLVICLTDDAAVGLVEEAVKQVLALHKDFPMKYFHIGADEVFQVCSLLSTSCSCDF